MTEYSRDALRALLEDDAVPEMLSLYQPEKVDVLTERLHGWSERLHARRFVLPVTGVQGSGKSSFLNALLFNRPVLPTDVDETTCVPVEIIYAATPSDEALVSYKDGRTARVAATEEGLASLVHNEHNPGNASGVERVVVECGDALLADGVVLVDLPGLGSITDANRDTTLTYISESVGAVFMLRTTPPLTQSESVFVGFVWPQVATTFFVQNRWTDETQAEAAAGRQHNQEVLERLRERFRLGETPIEIDVVDVYGAHTAALGNDADRFEASGANAVRRRLTDFAADWPQGVMRVIGSLTAGLLASSLGALRQSKVDCELEREDLEAEMAMEDKRFREFEEELRTEFKGLEGLLDEFVVARAQSVGTWRTDSRKLLRNEMRTVTRAGVVGGPRLNEALTGLQRGCADAAWSDFQEAAAQVQDKLALRLVSVPRWEPTRGDDVRRVSADKPTRVEELAPLAGSIAGTLAGAKAGAMLGAKLGLAGGPVAAAVGAFLGGMLGVYLGRRSRRAVVEVRAARVRPAIHAAIDTFLDGMRELLAEQARGLRVSVGAELDKALKAESERYDAERARRLEILSATGDVRNERLSRLNADEKTIANWSEQIQGHDHAD